jgi:hypothetical protein
MANIAYVPENVIQTFNPLKKMVDGEIELETAERKYL